MDLSKLPKLSDTKSQSPPIGTAAEGAPPQPVLPQPGGYQNPGAYRPPGIGGEIWISLVIGILFVYVGKDFGSYLKAVITHQTYHTQLQWDSDGPKGAAGSEIKYFDLPGCTAWSDMGIFVFGLTLLFEAIAKTFIALKPGTFSRGVLMFAIVLTLLAVVLNIIACMKMFGAQITPLWSVLAVAFGGWILFDEWSTLMRMTPVRDRTGVAA